MKSLINHHFVHLPSASPSYIFYLVEGAGFEPAKAEPSDLQSDPFGRSGTPPKKRRILRRLTNRVNQTNHLATLNGHNKIGADTRIRTLDLLITSQLLYQLSYVGKKPVSPNMGKEGGAYFDELHKKVNQNSVKINGFRRIFDAK
jgi:hypothetical protein